jgi:tetratricopeptide (TPR) repeat protein
MAMQESSPSGAGAVAGDVARRGAPEGAPAPAPVQGAAPDASAERRLARELALALADALRCGRLDQAQRLASTSARLAHRHSSLCEQLARLRMAQGDGETALAIIDGCMLRPASLRLLRAACLIQLGRAPEAHLDLHRWSRLSTAPLNARVMLALLELERGDAEAALAALRRNPRSLEDRRTLAAQALACLENDCAPAARRVAVYLAAAPPCDDAARAMHLMLHSLGAGVHHRRAPVTEGRVARLAVEVLANEQVIPVLVDIHLRQPNLELESLLTRAIEQALPHLDDRSAAMVQLARLARSRGRLEAAHRWIRSALEQRPMSATIARLHREIGPQKPSAGAEIAGRVGPATGQEKAA